HVRVCFSFYAEPRRVFTECFALFRALPGGLFDSFPGASPRGRLAHDDRVVLDPRQLTALDSRNNSRRSLTPSSAAPDAALGKPAWQLCCGIRAAGHLRDR